MTHLRHIWQKHFHLWLYALVDEAERLYRLRIYDERTPSYVGCNAIARVGEVMHSGAFLDIGNKRQAFMRRLPPAAKIGDLLAVSVDRHLPDDKGLRVTAGWQWQSRYAVLTARQGQMGQKEQARQKETHKDFADLWHEALAAHGMETENHRLNILPSARYLSDAEKPEILRRNFSYLLKAWQQAETLLQQKNCRPQILPHENFLQQALLDMPMIKAPICFGDAQTMKNAEAALENLAPDLCEDFTLSKHDTNGRLIMAGWRELLENPLIFGEGARFFIDETAAATVIDLDSARQTDIKKAKMRKGGEDDILSLNLQAADEVMRLIGAADLAGVILVDFIRMKNPQARRRLQDRLKTTAKRLALSCDILGYSRSGFMEILRRRRGLSLRQNSAQNDIAMALIELSLAMAHYKKGTLRLTARSDIISALQKHHNDILQKLPLNLASDENLRFALVENTC